MSGPQWPKLSNYGRSREWKVTWIWKAVPSALLRASLKLKEYGFIISSLLVCFLLKTWPIVMWRQMERFFPYPFIMLLWKKVCGWAETKLCAELLAQEPCNTYYTVLWHGRGCGTLIPLNGKEVYKKCLRGEEERKTYSEFPVVARCRKKGISLTLN